MKYIKIPQDYKQSVITDFLNFLDNNRALDKTVTYTCKMNEVDDANIIKPIVFFSAKAWLKMTQLVANYSSEIAWHGIVIREENRFLVEDIFIYPQIVTGATVNADDDAYVAWNIALDDDIANALRLQGHSHVHMNVSPSAVDKGYYDTILNSLRTDGWYIFMILNKRSELHIEIHDFSQNVIFEEKDITIEILLSNSLTVSSWIDSIKENVKTHVVSTSSCTTGRAYKQSEYTEPRGYYNDYGHWDDETFDSTRFGMQNASKPSVVHNSWRDGVNGYVDKKGKWHPYPTEYRHKYNPIGNKR